MRRKRSPIPAETQAAAILNLPEEQLSVGSDRISTRGREPPWTPGHPRREPRGSSQSAYEAAQGRESTRTEPNMARRELCHFAIFSPQRHQALGRQGPRLVRTLIEKRLSAPSQYRFLCWWLGGRPSLLRSASCPFNQYVRDLRPRVFHGRALAALEQVAELRTR